MSDDDIRKAAEMLRIIKHHQDEIAELDHRRAIHEERIKQVYADLNALRGHS